MEHQSTKPGTVDRVKHWLLNRRHILKNREGEENTTALLRLCVTALVGWALTRAPLLFSVNPLPACAVIASSHSTLALLSGVLFGLWQGAPHPTVTMLMIGVGLLTRLCLRLFFYPAGQECAEQRRQYRRAVLARLLLTLRQLCQNDTDVKDEPSPKSPPLPTSLRTLSATVGGMAGGLLLCILGGFAFYDLFGAVLLLLLSPVACALYCFSFDDHRRRSRTLRSLLGHGALLFSVCFCLRSIFFFYLSPAVALLLALSLFLTLKSGLLIALGCLLLGGLAIDLTILPPLLVTLLLYALLWRRMGRAALILATVGALATTLAAGSELFLHLAPSVCAGILLMSVLLSVQVHRSRAQQPARDSYRHDTTATALIAEKRRCDRLSARLCTMAGAFDAISEIMARMQTSPAEEPPPLPCAPSPVPFAQHCAVMASILRDAGNENAATLSPDDQLSQQLGKALKEQGAQFRHLCVLTSGNGRCRIQLHGCSPAHLGIDEKKLHRIAERITGATLRPAEFDETGEDGGVLTLRPRPALSVVCSSRSIAAGEVHFPEAQKSIQPRENKKAPFCGDSIRFFSDGQERFCALLCDGMGTGERAALTSQTSVLLLERLLRAGVGCDTALSLLILCLRSRRGAAAEISSTVDLMVLDPFCGRARFIKSGAADTLIWRDGQLFKISSRTFPLGILTGVDMQLIPFTLRTGDCVLMMSDGVADALLTPTALCALQSDDTIAATVCDEHILSLLRACPPTDDDAVAALSERILAMSRERGSEDDMTVALLRIVQN